MKPIDFILSIIAGICAYIGICLLNNVVLGSLLFVIVLGFGQYYWGEGKDLRERRHYNKVIYYRQAQREDYQSKGGEGDPPNLMPLPPLPTQPSLALGFCGFIIAMVLIFIALKM